MVGMTLHRVRDRVKRENCARKNTTLMLSFFRPLLDLFFYVVLILP